MCRHLNWRYRPTLRPVCVYMSMFTLRPIWCTSHTLTPSHTTYTRGLVFVCVLTYDQYVRGMLSLELAFSFLFFRLNCRCVSLFMFRSNFMFYHLDRRFVLNRNPYCSNCSRNSSDRIPRERERQRDYTHAHTYT